MGLLDIIGGAGARRPTRGTCFVHLGVSGRAERFTLERTAWNEASFACPDERGFQPQRAPIAADDGSTVFSRQTRLPVQELARRLTARGFDTEVSDDPGRFVCNYLYYQSLRANTTEPQEPQEPRCANLEPMDGGKEGGGGGAEAAAMMEDLGIVLCKRASDTIATAAATPDGKTKAKAALLALLVGEVLGGVGTSSFRDRYATASAVVAEHVVAPLEGLLGSAVRGEASDTDAWAAECEWLLLKHAGLLIDLRLMDETGLDAMLARREERQQGGGGGGGQGLDELLELAPEMVDEVRGLLLRSEGGGVREDEEQHGGTNQGTNQDPHVLFVHVPPFERIPRDRQEAFVAALLSELRAVILHPAEGGKGGEGGEGGEGRGEGELERRRRTATRRGGCWATATGARRSARSATCAARSGGSCPRTSGGATCASTGRGTWIAPTP